MLIIILFSRNTISWERNTISFPRNNYFVSSNHGNKVRKITEVLPARLGKDIGDFFMLRSHEIASNGTRHWPMGRGKGSGLVIFPSK